MYGISVQFLCHYLFLMNSEELLNHIDFYSLKSHIYRDSKIKKYKKRTISEINFFP